MDLLESTWNLLKDNVPHVWLQRPHFFVLFCAAGWLTVLLLPFSMLDFYLDKFPRKKLVKLYINFLLSASAPALFLFHLPNTAHWIQSVVTPLLMPFMRYNTGPVPQHAPKLDTMARDILVQAFLMDLVYYWWHRLAHAFPVIYKYVHKEHHKYTTEAAAIVAVQASLLEDISMYFNTYWYLIVTRSHPLTIFVYIFIFQLHGLVAHSSFFRHFHLKHHEHHKCYFSNFFISDFLFGTTCSQVCREKEKKA